MELKLKLNELSKVLGQENEIEREQRIGGYNINDKNLPYDEVEIPRMPSDDFFKEGNIFINKHHRYSEMPFHTHEFVEFNYMFSGSCIQYVDDQRIDLKEGEILLMDKDTVQRIESLGKNDILINILLKGDTITTEIFINMMKSSGLINEFLVNASSNFSNHKAFLHFHCSKNEDVQAIVQKMIVEYFNKQKYYMRELNLFLSLLMIELMREIEEEASDQDEEILVILQYIKANYVSLSLTQLSEHFGYNANYISNKLKKETGHTFQELINVLRYQTALELIEESNKTIEEIAYEVGFETIPSLYKLFSKYTSKTPKEVKQDILKRNTNQN